MKLDFKATRNINLLHKLAFLLSVLGVLLIIYDFGFNQHPVIQKYLHTIYFFIVIIGIFSLIIRQLMSGKRQSRSRIIFEILTFIFAFFSIFSLILSRYFSFEFALVSLKVAIALTFIREYSDIKIGLKRSILSPEQVFIVSFLGVIILGAFLLMLPNATFEGISFIDAIFTSTSAVCVTGLVVVDTGTYFTLFGKTIIIFLIQVGGLGILTFASYLSYFFRGDTSYENQLVLGEINNSKQLSEVFVTLKRIILITLCIELIGAIFIFFTVSSQEVGGIFHRFYFSFFHSISAFCNAGFSTYNKNVCEPFLINNYGFQLVLTLLILFGGLGFPIVINILYFFKYKVKAWFYKREKVKAVYRPWVLSINSRLVLITSFILTFGGALLYYLIEYNNTLTSHSGFGKTVVSLFGAVTPRTAGFNNVDYDHLRFSTILLTYLLMWIGASPASTGGGIKTSTFTIATLNFISLARGKARIEVFRREISENSVRRAFAVISLSLVTIGFGVFLISIFDAQQELIKIGFECFSAYNTVGLSMNLTSKLSDQSLLVLVGLMFAGRVGMLTILISIFKKVKHKNYRYPTEEILIN